MATKEWWRKYYVKNIKKYHLRQRKYYNKNRIIILERSKKYRNLHPVKRAMCNRNSGLKFWYGIDSKKYDSMLQNQSGRCAICSGKPKRRHLDVDHDHATNIVRGLLCGNCNRGLGMFKHDSKILVSASKYISGVSVER